MQQFRPTFPTIFKIASPIAFSLLVPQIGFIVTTLFITELGNEALSVIGMVSIYYLLLTWMGYGINNAMLMLLSNAAGAQDSIAYRHYFQNGLLINICFILIMYLTTIFGFEAIYNLFIQDKVFLRQCSEFLDLRIYGFPFLIFNQMINVLFISMGKTMKLLWGSIIGNAVNIFLNYVWIFGKWGFPGWGINGAALGSALGEVAYFLIMLVMVLQSKEFLRFQLLKKIRYHAESIHQIVKASGPLIFQYIFSIGGWQLFFILMEKKGHEYVAATHIIRNALGLIGVCSWSLASTSNTMMGNFLGQKRTDYITEGIKKLCFVAAAFGTMISLVLYGFRNELIAFYTKDTFVSELVLTGMQVIYFSGALMSISTVVFNAVIGVGKTRQSMIFEVTSVIVYCLYLYIIVEIAGMNYWWSWTSDWIYWMTLLLFSGFYIRRFVQKNNSKELLSAI